MLLTTFYGNQQQPLNIIQIHGGPDMKYSSCQSFGIGMSRVWKGSETEMRNIIGLLRGGVQGGGGFPNLP